MSSIYEPLTWRFAAFLSIMKNFWFWTVDCIDYLNDPGNNWQMKTIVSGSVSAEWVGREVFYFIFF